jgi:hypothetical protein
VDFMLPLRLTRGCTEVYRLAQDKELIGDKYDLYTPLTSKTSLSGKRDAKPDPAAYHYGFVAFCR